MPITKNRRSAPGTRKAVYVGKRRSKITGRPRNIRKEEAAPAVIANSAFALKLKPKAWADLSHDRTAEDPKQLVLYKDLVRAYNHGADLVGAEKIVYKQSNSTIAGIADVLQLFRSNICPKGFDVNIDEHYNNRTKKQHFHFSIYRTAEISPYWHFFEIGPLVKNLWKTNKKLHDLFIVFLRSFISNCSIPTWFDGNMSNAQFTLSDYVSELRGLIETPGLEVQNALDRTGYTIKDMQDRLAGIEKTMKEYATGQAYEYMQQIIKAKPLKPHYLLRSLKKFPGQHKVVRFMKHACEFMKEKAGVADFCYHHIDGYDEEGLTFEEQVAIIWDWSDHYSATEGRHIEDMANHVGVFHPTLCARITPEGTHGLNMDDFVNCLSWPQRFSLIQQEFQAITEKFTDYKEQRNLI